MNPVRVVELGRRAYRPVLLLQRALVRARLEGTLTDDLLLLVEHDPVVTLGRGTRETSLPVAPALLPARGYDVYEVERGGDVTVHAPGQLVGYPILDLQQHRPDLHWYLRQLEQSLINALSSLSIPAERNPGLTGVWTAGRKIASIGVHVKRWVTLHGFALNVTTDLSWFDPVVPCGINGVVMTSIERERQPPTANRDDLWRETLDAVTQGFGQAFEREMVPGSPGGVDAIVD
jgi:lipoate-protein ligase B